MVVTALLSDLLERDLEVSGGVLVVLDGAKALRKAVDGVLCPSLSAWVRRKLREAWSESDHGAALAGLKALTKRLERADPGAAASLRKGIVETLTVTRLGLRGELERTLASTNPCESMIEIVRDTQRGVK